MDRSQVRPAGIRRFLLVARSIGEGTSETESQGWRQDQNPMRGCGRQAGAMQGRIDQGKNERPAGEKAGGRLAHQIQRFPVLSQLPIDFQFIPTFDVEA